MNSCEWKVIPFVERLIDLSEKCNFFSFWVCEMHAVSVILQTMSKVQPISKSETLP